MTDTLLAMPLALLPWPDWLALAVFFAAWVGYARFAKRQSRVKPSLLGCTNGWRGEWMRQALGRDNRIVDAAVTQNLSASPAFFASTSILVVGGLLAALAGGGQASDLMRELPFAARTSVLVFDLKLALLAGVFVYAFFRFTWSMRQYSFGAVLVGAAPPPDALDEAIRERFAQRAGQVMGLAAETFNDGLRAYYFSFAAMAWFISPLALVLGTMAVVGVLYMREFRSEVLHILREDR